MEIGQQILNGKYTVTGIKTIINHGKYYPNKKVNSEFFVEGKRGATYRGVLFQDGKFIVETGFGQTPPSYSGIVLYDGETGQVITPIAVV